jgi:hypothetical protein
MFRRIKRIESQKLTTLFMHRNTVFIILFVQWISNDSLKRTDCLVFLLTKSPTFLKRLSHETAMGFMSVCCFCFYFRFKFFNGITKRFPFTMLMGQPSPSAKICHRLLEDSGRKFLRKQCIRIRKRPDQKLFVRIRN